MVRVHLRGDLTADGEPCRSVRVHLDGDGECVAQGDVPTLPTMTVWRRERTGYDDDGDPTFEWSAVIVDAPVTVVETRTEVDDIAGLTRRVVVATVGYDDADLDETSVVRVESDMPGMFAVRKIVRGPGTVEFTMEVTD